MTDLEPVEPQPVPEPAPEPVPATIPAEPPANKSRRTLLIVGGVILIVLVCAGICLFTAGASLFKTIGERDNVQKVVDTFMQAMADRDASRAYNLFSTRAQRHTKLSDIEKLLEGNNFVLFRDYQSVSVDNINLTAAMNTNPDLPQGSVATINGTITYSDGFSGHFEAVLEQEGTEWRLFNINVTVPPDKLKSEPST